jgi:RHS repeat-associated protein
MVSLWLQNMEKDDEVKGKGNSYDFGARMYDSRLGRWLSIDPLAAKYPDLNPYNFVANMPIIAIDPDGKEIIINITPRENKKPLIEITVSGVIINESNKTFTSSQIQERLKTFQKEINDTYNKSFDEFELKVTLDFKEVKTQDEINSSDHLISIREPWKRNVGGKVNRIGGKVMFLNAENFSKFKDRPRPHELGHLLGLLHPWDNGFEDEFKAKKKNIMAYDEDVSNSIPVNQFTIEAHQVKQIVKLYYAGKLNQGDNKNEHPTSQKYDPSYNLSDYEYNPREVSPIPSTTNDDNKD